MAIDPANPVPPQYPRIAGKDNIPDHVPEELAIANEIPFGPSFLVDPLQFLADFHHNKPPIFYGYNDYGNAWILTKHEDGLFMLRESEIFSNEGATPFPRDPDDYYYFIPIEIDPPDHRQYRAILDPVFSPKGVVALEENIRKLANNLIDDIIDKGECEFTEAFGRPLPVLVFLDLMGLPLDKRDTFVKWAVDLLHSQDREVMAESMRLITAYLKEVIVEKTKNPDDKVISRIINGEVHGRPMSEPEIFGFVIFLFIGGLDTVFATLNHIWAWMAQNPDRRKEMRDNPEQINAQVEELVRSFAVTFSGRVLSRDYEMRGIKMKKGDRITAILPTCNFDPDVFPNPREVDFNRKRRINLTFAGGAHSCMGAHLARLEIKVALQEWLRCIPEFELAAGTKVEYRPGGVIGPEYVPLVW